MRILLFACLLGCQTTLDEADHSVTCMEATAHADLAWLQTNVLSTSCTFSSCHSGTAAHADHLVLTMGASHDQLVGVASVESASWKRVAPGDPDHSYLLVALGASDGPPPHDGIMPLDSAPLCSEKLSAFRAWIAAGAPP